MNAQITLSNAVALWNEAKAREDAAKADRQRAADAIAVLLPSDNAESTLATAVDGFKVTVERKVTRKVDGDALAARWASLPANVQGCFKWSAEVSLKNLRGLMEHAPKEYAEIAPCITTKPSTPSVKVEAAKAA